MTQTGSKVSEGADSVVPAESAETAAAASVIERLERLATRHDAVVAGRRIAWRRLGDGPPLVLLHGGHGSWLHWVRNLEAWSHSHTVWVPDMPGYGDSDDAAGPALDDLVDALAASLERLIGPQTPFALAGFSFGGVVASAWAARQAQADAASGAPIDATSNAALNAQQPSQVRALVLLGSGGHGGTRRPRGRLRAWQDLPPHSPPWVDTMRHNLLMHMLHAETSVDALALAVHGRACLGTRFRSKAIARAPGTRAAIDAFGGPVLLIWGEHDITAVPAEAASALASPHPGSATQVVKGAGHWVQYEQAEAVNRLVTDWLVARRH